MSTNRNQASAWAVMYGEIVRATVLVEAPPERVFAALNSSEVERWWGSADTYSMRGWHSDMQPGGEWRVNVCLADGTSRPASGRFLEVDAPRRVMMTRRYDWEHPRLGRTETVVTYRFDRSGSGTRVTVWQEGFNGPEAAREHAEGWERVLNWLRGYFVYEEQGRAVSS